MDAFFVVLFVLLVTLIALIALVVAVCVLSIAAVFIATGFLLLVVIVVLSPVCEWWARQLVPNRYEWMKGMSVDWMTTNDILEAIPNLNEALKNPFKKFILISVAGTDLDHLENEFLIHSKRTWADCAAVETYLHRLTPHGRRWREQKKKEKEVVAPFGAPSPA